MMDNLCNMSMSDKVKLLVTHYGYDQEEIESLESEEVDSMVKEVAMDFEESDLKVEIEDSGLIDFEDEEMNLLEILDQWDEIHDESDMYPNGRDYDSENLDD